MALQPLVQQLGRTTLGTAVAYKVAKGGHKRGSLNRDGAVAAFTVAALAFSCSFRSGITLLCFYKTGSMLTKYGAAVKQKLEDANSVRTAWSLGALGSQTDRKTGRRRGVPFDAVLAL